MKKVLLIVALLSGLAANAQESSTWSLQPQAGWTYASFTGRNADHVQSWAGWTAGVNVEKQFSRLLSVSGGLHYSRIGGRNAHGGYGYSTSLAQYNERYFRYRFEYLYIPVLLNVHLKYGFTLKTGIQPGFLLGAKMYSQRYGYYYQRLPNIPPSALIASPQTNPELYTKENFNEEYKRDISSDVDVLDFCIPVGLSYEYKNVQLDVRYHFGLLKVLNGSVHYVFDRMVDDGGSKDFQNRYLSVTLGYRFHL